MCLTSPFHVITKNSYEMGPGLQQEDDRRHDESAGCAVAAPAKVSAAAARAEEYSALVAGSVGALATIYAALAVQAAEGQEGQLIGPEALSKAVGGVSRSAGEHGDSGGCGVQGDSRDCCRSGTGAIL